MQIKPFVLTSALGAMSVITGSTVAQFDPTNAQWGKDVETDVRVMTYNVRDGIRSQNLKNLSFSNWAALARTVAAVRPDVLMLQEAGDNGFADSTQALTTTVELFFHGGDDPFRGGTVTEYVQKYAPGYDLPFIFVSTATDNFNRNVIVSRWPLTDINGDGKATTSSFSTVNGSSGVRGIQFAEIDLPNDTYLGDLVVSNAHLKAFGDPSDIAERAAAATALSTYMWNFYNGAGTPAVDPQSRVNDFPPATLVLGPNTAIIWGGDYNEDELTNGRDGPVQISIQNTPQGGGAGTDADGSNATADTAVDFFTGSRATQSSSKLDWLMHQDSVAGVRNQFVFNSSNIPTPSMPTELVGFGPSPQFATGQAATGTASDHRPVVVDYVLPLGESDLIPGAFDLLSPVDGAGNVFATQSFTWEAADNADTYTITIANDPELQDVLTTVDSLPAPQAFVSGLGECRPYYWAVDAHNIFGSRRSATFAFTGFSPADQNFDGVLTGADFNGFLTNFSNGNTLADVNRDGVLTGSDFNAFLTAFSAGCGL